MLNLQEIENTIEELENSTTTFSNCEKLASLYIVREHFKSSLQTVVEPLPTPYNKVVTEYKDILPSYNKYCEMKQRYQLGETQKQFVINTLISLCVEIKEFLETLYSNTDTVEEREVITKYISNMF